MRLSLKNPGGTSLQIQTYVLKALFPLSYTVYSLFKLCYF